MLVFRLFTTDDSRFWAAPSDASVVLTCAIAESTLVIVVAAVVWLVTSSACVAPEALLYAVLPVPLVVPNSVDPLNAFESIVTELPLLAPV